MVSAKKDGAKTKKGAALNTRNKDGDLKSKSGRKPKNQLQTVPRGTTNSLNGRYWKDKRARMNQDQEFQELQESELFVHIQDQNNNNRKNARVEKKDTGVDITLQAKRKKPNNERIVLNDDCDNNPESNIIHPCTRGVTRRTVQIDSEDELVRLSNISRELELTRLRTIIKRQQENAVHVTTPKSNLNYRMKVDKFHGSKDNDYDIWLANMQAFFELHNFTELEYVKLFNAHLGGEARGFIQEKDLLKINTVAKMDEALRVTFSQKQDRHNIQMNIKQRADEDVRAFSVRLRVAARKCGHKGDNLDKTSVNCLKRGCAPYLSTLLDNCLPHTPYDEIVEHAIQFERKQESLKKQLKHKIDTGHSDDNETTKINRAKLEVVKK